MTPARRLRRRYAAASAVALALAVAAVLSRTPARVVRAESVMAPPAAPFTRGTLVSLKGTPHVWVADERGVLHWVGDIGALIRHLAAERDAANRPVDQSDFVLDAAKAYFDIIPEVSLDQLRAAPRGEPWTSSGFVTLGDAIYVVRKDVLKKSPALLRVQSTADLDLLGVSAANYAANYAANVLDKATWEGQYGGSLDALPRAELRPVLPVGQTPPPCLPVVDELQILEEGVAAVVRNACGTAARFGLSAVLLDEGRLPVGTTREALWDAPSGDSRRVLLFGDTEDVAAASPLASAIQIGPAPPAIPIAPAGAVAGAGPPASTGGSDTATPATICVDVGASRCLEMDPWLYRSAEILRGFDDGQSLLRTAAEFGVVVRHLKLIGLYGLYEPMTRTVSIADVLDRYSDWERAAVLAHELQHAADHASGLFAHSAGDACVGEAHAFRREAHVWMELWQSRLPVARSVFQEEQNKITEEAQVEPEGMPQTLQRLHYDCSPDPGSDQPRPAFADLPSWPAAPSLHRVWS